MELMTHKEWPKPKSFMRKIDLFFCRYKLHGYQKKGPSTCYPSCNGAKGRRNGIGRKKHCGQANVHDREVKDNRRLAEEAFI